MTEPNKSEEQRRPAGSVRFADNRTQQRARPLIPRPQKVDDASFVVKFRSSKASTPTASYTVSKKKPVLAPSSSLELTDSGADRGDDDDDAEEKDDIISEPESISECNDSQRRKTSEKSVRRRSLVPADARQEENELFVPLTTLPWHVQRRIFAQLSCPDRRHLRVTCRFLSQALNSSEYWRNACCVLRDTRDYTPEFWKTLAQRQLQALDLGNYRREVEWEQLGACAPDVKWLRSWVKCDKNSGLPEGIHKMIGLQYLEVTTLFADWALFADLRRFAFLRTLKLNVTVMHVSFDRQQALRWLFDLTELEDIELTFRRYVILDQSQLRHLLFRLPKLRRLALCRQGFRFVDISSCFRRPQLPADWADSARYVQRLRLRELDLSGTLKQSLDDEAMQQLATLETFRLHRHDMDDEQIDYFLERVFEYWRNLVCLDLRGAIFSADVLNALKSKTLQQMHFSFKHVDYAQRALTKLSQKAPALTELYIYDVTQEDATKLKYLPDYFPKLKTLRLHGNLGTLSREFLFALAELRHACVIDITDCRACPEGVWDILRELVGEHVNVVDKVLMS